MAVHSFIQVISIAPLQVHYYSEALPTQHGYCVRVSRWSANDSCEWRTTNEPPRPMQLFISWCLHCHV